jgi:hypothetical protein
VKHVQRPVVDSHDFVAKLLQCPGPSPPRHRSFSTRLRHRTTHPTIQPRQGRQLCS